MRYRILGNDLRVSSVGFGCMGLSAYDYRSVMPQFTAGAMDKNRELLELIKEMARQENATPAQISLAWMLC